MPSTLSIFTLVKKYWYFSLLLVLALITLILRTFTPPPPPSPPPPPPLQVGWRDQVYPGTTNVNQLSQILGKPVNTATVAGQTILNYPTSDPNRTNQVYITSDHIDLIQEYIPPIDPRTKLTFAQNYGPPQATYYGPHSAAGFHLYSYASKGLAILAHEFTNRIFQIWYFTPMNTDDFFSQLAQSQQYSQVFVPLD